MEKQALLEDMALGSSATANGWRPLSGGDPPYSAPDAHARTQYGQELQLTEALRACRRDICQAEINELQTALTPSRAIRCSGWTSTSAPWRR
jgi:type VI secretion system protein VasG